MTGQYAHTNGLMGLVNGGWTIPEEKKTIVDYLNEAGYLTAHFGLQHERKPIEHNRYQIEGGGNVVTEHVVDAGIGAFDADAIFAVVLFIGLLAKDGEAVFGALGACIVGVAEFFVPVFGGAGR